MIISFSAGLSDVCMYISMCVGHQGLIFLDYYFPTFLVIFTLFRSSLLSVYADMSVTCKVSNISLEYILPV